jgi:hypothetical protein
MNPQPIPVSGSKDLIGICVPPLDHYFGLREFGSRGTQEIVRDPWDIVVYEARKAIRLLAKGNPNILSMLWLPEDLYLHVEPAGRRLIEDRDLFATKAVYMPFRGYAQGQLRKMTNGAYNGYMGKKRKALVDKHGFVTTGYMQIFRHQECRPSDPAALESAYEDSPLPEKLDRRAIDRLAESVIGDALGI